LEANLREAGFDRTVTRNPNLFSDGVFAMNKVCIGTLPLSNEAL